jgi:hypothetical protein
VHRWYDYLSKASIALSPDRDLIVEKNWTNADPTTTSTALIQLRLQIETLLCSGPDHRPECSCLIINNLYGNNLYRCDQPFCRFYRTGFRTCIERDKHRKIHERPYKCSDPGCFFAEFGFRSESEFKRHFSEQHQTDQYVENTPSTSVSTDQIPKPDLAQLLEDAVSHDQIDHVRQLFQSPIEANFGNLLGRASQYSSSAMVKCILDEAIKGDAQLNINDIEVALYAAIEAENLLVLRILIAEADLIMSQKGLSVKERNMISGTRMRSAFNICNGDVMSILVDHGNVVLPLKCPSRLFYSVMVSKRKDIDKVRRLHSMKKYIIWPEAFTSGVALAASVGSTTCVQFFLDNGGSPEGIVDGSSRNHRTVLWSCVQRGTIRYAEIAKLLLQHGANPDPQGRGISITRLKGMRRIEKYFEMSWSELVKQTQSSNWPLRTEHSL